MKSIPLPLIGVIIDMSRVAQLVVVLVWTLVLTLLLPLATAGHVATSSALDARESRRCYRDTHLDAQRPSANLAKEILLSIFKS